MALETNTIVAIYAHPDDEGGVAGTLARHARRGRVVAVCATRGELGEISDPSLATPENLGEVREGELRRAYAELGIEDVRFLNYRDSGMAGTEGNKDPRALMNADPKEAAEKIAAILREVGPALVLTFEETGGYGHPDHLAVHRFTTEAFKLAGSQGRLLYSGFPRALMLEMFGRAKDAGEDVGFFSELDITKLGLPDEAIDFVIDASDMTEQKLAAFRQHKTQFSEEDSFFNRFPEDIRERFWGREYYQFAAGVPYEGPKPGSDLFG
ncbi:MAG TPA: PIG-L family deacetylase [Nitrolancea sp.]|nr:PIG-L family deacetylase [Nitrolancea sp.]